MANEIGNIETLLKSYEEIFQVRAKHEITAFTGLTEEFKLKEQSLAELMRQTAPYYNIFEVLKIRHCEVRVHTPFIANLLNPKGSHHQAALFFNKFFDHVLKITNPHMFTDIKIFTERRYEDYGQIDLEIWYRVDGVQRGVVIENKIYHHDEEQQLYRYYQYLREYAKMDDCNLRLVYLTLDGKAPSAQSIYTTPKHLINQISYYQHISSWLNASLPLLSENRVYHIINQYLKTIQSL